MKFINIFIIYGLIIEPLKDQGPVSRKSRGRFGPEKPFVKLRPAYSVKLVFSYVIKGIKVKVTAKFRASRRLRFEDTKRIIARNTAGKFSRLSRNRHQLPVDLKTQLVEHCTCIAEVRVRVPVQAEFFRPLLLLLK